MNEPDVEVTPVEKEAVGARPGHETTPPDWARIPELDGIQRSSFGGVLVMRNAQAAQAIWRQVSGATEFDATLALTPFGDVLPDVAVARAKALVQARRDRPPRVTEDRWQRHLRRVWEDLSEEQQQNPEEVLIAALKEEAGERAARRLRTTRRPSGRPPVDRDERFHAVEAAVNGLREEAGFDSAAFGDVEEFRQEAYELRLTRKAIATRLGRQPSTLRRWAAEDPRIKAILDMLP